MVKNIVLWLSQVTIDRTFMLPNGIEKVCLEFVKKGLFSAHHEELKNISESLGDAQNRPMRDG